MGEAGGGDVLLGELQAAIRSGLGEAGEQAGKTLDLMTQTAALYWPVALMTAAAKKPNTFAAGADTLAAINVVAAKCREELEARMVRDPEALRVVGLLMRPVVVEFARVWFSDADSRLNVCRCIGLVRGLR